MAKVKLQKLERKSIQALPLKEDEAPRRWRRYSRTFLRFCREKPLGAVAAVIVVAIIFAAVFAPYIAPFDPIKSDIRNKMKAPNLRNWMGTDNLGRDVFSRVIYGARISLWVGILSVGMGVLSGMILGVLSGYFGGKVEIIIERIVDSVMAFPPLVLALAMVAVLGSNITNTMIAIAIVISPRTARVVRGSALTVRQEQYVEAARTTGCNHLRIILQHIVPNIMAPVIVMATVMFGNAIIVEAALGFLGLGTTPPTPSWGNMLSGATRQYLIQAPWLAIFPGVAISFAVLGFNLLGDALRDVLDPRLRI